MSNEGVIQVAFDACESGTCGTPRSTFSQKGDTMICYHCGMSSETCNPAPLDRTYDADNVIIALADLEQGKRLFTGGYPLEKQQ
jgi:uncharacterized membrane protein